MTASTNSTLKSYMEAKWPDDTQAVRERKVRDLVRLHMKKKTCVKLKCSRYTGMMGVRNLVLKTSVVQQNYQHA